jgi:hypothetical protein
MKKINEEDGDSKKGNKSMLQMSAIATKDNDAQLVSQNIMPNL